MRAIRVSAVWAAAALLVGGLAMAGSNSLDVNAGCASEGSFGLEAIHDGTSTNNVFVQTDTPADESIYRVSFDFNPNGMDAPHAGKWYVGAALQEGAGSRPFQAICSFNIVNGFRCWCQYIQNNGILAATGKVDVPDNSFNTMMYEWVQSDPAPDPANGVCRITNVTTTQTAESTGFRNAAFAVGRYRMGITGRAQVLALGDGGSHCFDDFQSFRTLSAP